MFVGTGKNVRSLYICFFNMIINVIIFSKKRVMRVFSDLQVFFLNMVIFSVNGGHGDVWGYG